MYIRVYVEKQPGVGLTDDQLASIQSKVERDTKAYRVSHIETVNEQSSNAEVVFKLFFTESTIKYSGPPIIYMSL